ncbi:hypothetical protein N658DRAFT_137800 [Parathielavia hyrcaniae]|uniref:Uncharacterized protein n=1 Tax=Parathielavia hyrcaniae TaxID=113614 RepID=A0AAN6T6M5_9PEZI|nr:hypothetical protein N658DRAFT_137800 [Parathielavia hyrcaniae]
MSWVVSPSLPTFPPVHTAVCSKRPVRSAVFRPPYMLLGMPCASCLRSAPCTRHITTERSKPHGQLASPSGVPSSRLSTARTTPLPLLVRCYATSDHEKAGARPDCYSLPCPRLVSIGPPIGKLEKVMKCNTAALQRGPYILRIAHKPTATSHPPLPSPFL